ncbi:MAG: glycosyltransferase [bacterium]|nr:glycosyltransferase [bacterium]
MIYNLAAGLAKLGHNVSVLASENSEIEGVNIIPVISKSFAELPPFENQFYAEVAYLVIMAKKLQDISSDFDIVHNHTFPEYINLLVEKTLPIPMVTTLHAPITPELEDVLSKFPDSNIVAQSESYRKALRKVQIKWVVKGGIETNVFSYSEKPRDYLLWIGRLGKTKDSNGNFIDGKGVRDAIEVAEKTGKKLLMVGNVEDQEFYKRDVLPHLSNNIIWLSSSSSKQTHSQNQVAELIQGAKILIFSTKFEEAFGLVAAEALSCGTPVIAYSRGSIPSIVKEGENGFLIKPSESVAGICKAVEKIYSMKDDAYLKMQRSARKTVEENFTIEKMVLAYEKLYTELIDAL